MDATMVFQPKRVVCDESASRFSLGGWIVGICFDQPAIHHLMGGKRVQFCINFFTFYKNEQLWLLLPSPSGYVPCSPHTLLQCYLPQTEAVLPQYFNFHIHLIRDHRCLKSADLLSSRCINFQSLLCINLHLLVTVASHASIRVRVTLVPGAIASVSRRPSFALPLNRVQRHDPVQCLQRNRMGICRMKTKELPAGVTGQPSSVTPSTKKTL